MSAKQRIFERRELNTILAALSYYRTQFLESNKGTSLDDEGYTGIASDGDVQPLSAAEIDALSDWLNDDSFVYRNKRVWSHSNLGPKYPEAGI